jgi:hypothetical protein
MNAIKEEASVVSNITEGGPVVGPETSVSQTTRDEVEDGTLVTGFPDDQPDMPSVEKESSRPSTTASTGGRSKKDRKNKGGGGSEVTDGPTGKDKKSKKPEKKVAVDAARELLELKICSIELSELIPGHRFKKNSPRIKVDYGEKHWESPYQKDMQGVTADFIDLGWEFILQRDTRHRDDLIVTVCSDEIIIGRYLLAAADFTDMPVTKSGYFKVSGKVVNALGIAGKIVVVFKKKIAEPPKAPRFTEANPYSIVANALPHDTRSYIRVVSIACADLKSLSMLESNSPHCILKCNEWKKTTDVKVGAGLACKWNRLPWKLVMDKFYSLLVEVKSQKELIGMVQLTLDELRKIDVDQYGFTEVIRQLTDGSTFSGRIRILLYIKDMPPTADDNTFRVDVPGLPYEEDYTREQQLTARGDIYAKAKMPSNAALALSSNLIRGAITYCPFVMRVSEAGVFDTKKCDLVKPNSLSISAACGAWGGSTFQVKNSGSDAYWVGLSSTWRFIVEDNSKLHLNVWSKNNYVGGVTLSAKDIKGYPIDPDGSTEILLTIKDEGKSTGRIRVNCVFEYYRKGENTNYDPQPEPVVYIPPRAKKMDLDAYGDVPKYELPSIAKIISVSVVDLKGMHVLKKNSPRVKIVCDRKQALTSVMKRGGKSARWVDLDWDIPINEGCIMMIYCYSENKQIGFVELNAHEIVDEPLDNYGMTSLSVFIRDHDGLSTGKLTLIIQLENVPDLDVYDRIVNGMDKDPYNLSNPIKSNVIKEEVDPILEMMATQPFFSLKDATATGTGIMLSVEIIELDVTDLDAVHYFGKLNSPVVSAACGRWADTTTVQPDAGESTFWTGLTWRFLIDDNLSVQFVVGSGNKVIGSVKASAKEFAVARADQRGVKRVTLSMFKDKRGHPHFTGRLKATYKLGVVRESQYIKRPRQIERLNVEDIVTPFNAIVKKVVARGMQKVHTIGPNEPRFRMTYDDYTKTTSVSSSGDSEEATWNGDNELPVHEWSCSVCDEDLSFTFTIISGSELVGIAEVKASDVMNIPRNIKGIAEVVVTLLKDNKQSGRLQVFLQLFNDKVVGPEISQEEEDAEQEKLAAEEEKALERQQYWEAKQKLLGNDVILQQQEAIAPVMTVHTIEKERAEREAELRSRVANAESDLKRNTLEQEMARKRDEVMMVQHKLMLSQPVSHKFAPVGDFPAGYVPREEHMAKLLKGSGLENEEDDHSEGYDPNGEEAAKNITVEELAELQAAVTKETKGFQFRLKSDLAVAKDMIKEAGWEGYCIAHEDDAGDIQLVKIHQDHVAPLRDDNSSIGTLKSKNPPLIPNTIRMADDLTANSIDMEDFDDDGSVVHAPALKSSAKVINTNKAYADFEGNLDDDASLNMSRKPARKSGKKVTPIDQGLDQVESIGSIESGMAEGLAMIEKAGKMVGTGIGGTATKGKSYAADGLITNKFADYEVNQMEHALTSVIATSYTIVIKQVAVLDVVSAHVMSKNSLQMLARCTGASAGVDDTTGVAQAATEPVEFTSDIMKNCGDAANWPKLSYTFECFGRRRQTISLTFTSGSKEVAYIEWKTDELYREAIKDKPGTVIPKFCEMRDGTTFRGKIKIMFTLTPKPNPR